MISEEIYKKNLIQALNSVNIGWIDGDKKIARKKTADIVNHSLKIAVEIKDDTKYKTELPTTPGVMVTTGHDLTKMNQRFSDSVRSANRKFKEYPEYKTILLFRTEFFIIDIVRYAIEGLHSYSKPKDHLVYTGRTGKYSKYNKQEIGCFLIVNQGEYYYFPNIFVRQNRSFNKGEVEKIFGHNFNNVPKI